jgi:hypothetical protein
VRKRAYFKDLFVVLTTVESRNGSEIFNIAAFLPDWLDELYGVRVLGLDVGYCGEWSSVGRWRKRRRLLGGLQCGGRHLCSCSVALLGGIVVRPWCVGVWEGPGAGAGKRGWRLLDGT